MQANKKLFILILSFVSFQNIFAQLKDRLDGKCYWLCTVDFEFIYHTETVAVFQDTVTDIMEDSIFIENIYFKKIKKAKKGIIKMRILCDSTCSCPEGNLYKNRTKEDLDKMTSINCYIEVVEDTFKIKNFILQKVTVIEQKCYPLDSEWKEVLCKNEITVDIVRQIQMILKMNNLYDRKFTNKFDVQTERALNKYQKINHLPIGYINLETLDAMGIVR
ncbi:MAG: peptidoglycan-binding domain-containing protein [Saprospiraceae bacterium]